MSGIDVIIEDFKTHPHCPHGPTILFSRREPDGNKRNFYACAACRDRKQCSYFQYQDENRDEKKKDKLIKQQSNKINHRKLFLTLNEIKNLPQEKRSYCQTCSEFLLDQYKIKHKDHKLINNLSDYQISHPTEILPALENPKKEAQFLFSQSAVETLINILNDLNYKDVICVGTPRIHEHISSNCSNMSSLLLDIDNRFLNFFGPLEFCWYNSFNHHFFLAEARNVFEDFLQTNDGKQMILITDPPFGGRIEPLAYVLNLINKQYKSLNKIKTDLPIFLIFPYFMEPQILNSLPNFKMLDYKVEYDNHPLFHSEKNKGRKYGSPVRIFTNINPCLIQLPADQGYKYCKLCKKWVYSENKHCKLCGKCTSKDGRTYVHCKKCEKCVKPSWIHCEKCKRCSQPDHKCEQLNFVKECFHCKKSGHKKRECPEINQEELQDKRKKRRKL